MEATTRFFYSTLVPAIGLVPIWFTHGRYWYLGVVNDWVETDDTSIPQRALPAFLAFHVVLWWWERKRDHPLPEVALALWGYYMLHLLLQGFYVIQDVDETTGQHHDFCVASYYWTVIPLSFCQRMEMGLMIDLWIVMGATLLVSWWDDAAMIRVHLQLQRKITQSLKPAVVWMPLWFALGHLTLGSGYRNLWNTTTLILALEALLVVLPFHWMLWNHHKDNPLLLFDRLTKWLLLYYVGQWITQFFVAHDNLVQHYLRLQVATVSKVALICKGLLLLLMVIILNWSYYHEPRHEAAGGAVASSGNTTSVAAAADTATNNSAVEATASEAMRVPLLPASEESQDVVSPPVQDTTTTANQDEEEEEAQAAEP